VTSSSSTPPAEDSTEMFSGGRAVAGTSEVKVPVAGIAPPNGPTTVSEGGGTDLSLEVADTVSVRVSESKVAVVTSS
jgi:hypothetical protein